MSTLGEPSNGRNKAPNSSARRKKSADKSGNPYAYSRYLSDFKSGPTLGRGSFGRVVLATNVLDSRQYAVKVIRLPSDSGGQRALFDKILREVEALAHLQHTCVVR